MGCMCDGNPKVGCIPMVIRLTIPINPVPNELPNVDIDMELCWCFPGGSGTATNSVLRDLGGVFRSTPLTPFALSIEFVDQLSPKELCSKFIPEQEPISSECSLPVGYELRTQGQCRFFDGRST